MDIEKAIVKYLYEQKFDTYYQVPAKRPKTFVTVEMTGSGDNNIATETYTVAVQCWAPTRQAAHDLCAQVKQSLRGAHLANINRITVSNEYSFPDENNNPRYQLVLDVVANI